MKIDLLKHPVGKVGLVRWRNRARDFWEYTAFEIMLKGCILCGVAFLVLCVVAVAGSFLK